MTFYRKNYIIILILLSLTSEILIQAQSSDSTRLPSLGKHVFTSISGVEDPFIRTKISLTFGLTTLVDTEIPINIPGKDETVNFKPDLFYTFGGLVYQHAVTDWAAMHIKSGGLARVGSDVVSIATQGVSAASFLTIGLMLKLIENNNLSFAGAVDLNTSSLTYIDLSGKFEDIIADSTAGVQVINNYQILSGNMQFRFAYKFNEVLGLMAKANGSVGEIYAKESENKFNWAIGSVFSVDLRNWMHIPFGIGVGGNIVSNDWQFTETNHPLYTVNLNISFINQNDFVVELENFIQIVEYQQYNKTFNFHYTRISLSYYF